MVLATFNVLSMVTTVVGVIVEVTIMVALVILLIAIVVLSKVFFALEGVGENVERQRTHRSIVLLHLPRRQVGGSHQVRDLPHGGAVLHYMSSWDWVGMYFKMVGMDPNHCAASCLHLPTTTINLFSTHRTFCTKKENLIYIE